MHEAQMEILRDKVEDMLSIRVIDLPAFQGIIDYAHIRITSAHRHLARHKYYKLRIRQ